jgi:plastocyanin
MKRLGVALVVAMLFGACGGGDRVGEAFEDFEGGKGDSRIGDVSETAKPKATAKAAGGSGGTTATAAPKQSTPKPAAAAEPDAGIEVRITSGGFDPTAARVVKGSTVKVTNVDTAPHTYTSSDATYDTGSIPPGQSKTFQVSSTGSFQMEDRTRNWIIGSLEVVAG